MSLSPSSLARSALLLLVLCATAVQQAQAQYFGRNNPQFRTFDFQVLQTEHFDIYYYPEADEGVRDAALMAERWYTRLSRILGHELSARQPLILYGAHGHFQQTNILGSPVGEGTGGVTESAKQRIIMPLAHTYGQTDHVLGHELVHAFQYDISGLGRSAGSIDAGARALAQAPLWWVEGMAEYLTLGPVDTHTAMWLRDAAVTGRLPTLEQLATDPRIFPYRYGHAIWSYITGRWGDQVVGEILRAVGRGETYAAAMREVLGVSLDDLSGDWRVAVQRTYLPLLATHNEAREVATPLITAQTRGGRVNVGPALSRDGRYLAFLSERGFLDIELWLADASTGQVIRRLVRGAAFDAHFGSLNFIASAGSFSPDGRQLAFAALRRGHNVIAIVDVERGGVAREILIPDVPEITNPSWSPDGRSIAFAGTQGGITNIFLHDLVDGTTRQLTTGRNADLMPSFSPDGGRIAFVTDRGRANLETLETGLYGIAILDVATGEIALLPDMEGARNFNPVWTADGTAIHFISDRTGIANVHRAEVATGAVTTVTTVFRGISGITELSPALAAGGNDQLVFSVFEQGNYNLYRYGREADPAVVAALPAPPPPPPTDVPAELVAAPLLDPGLDAPIAAVLPPAPRPAAEQYRQVITYLADALDGLPAPEVAAAWTVAPYRPRLSLDFIAQPMVGVSVGGGGGIGQGGLQGGIAAVFSDMLAWHTLFGVIQAQGRLDEFGFSTVYLYRRLPTDFGVGLQRIPYVSAARQQFFDPEANLLRDQVLAYRTFDWQLQGLMQLPLSRVQRIEFSSGLRRLSRDLTIQEIVRDPVRDPAGNIIGFTNPRVQEQRQPLDAINLAQGAAALVFDNALLGWTSPFAGQRYRFEVSPTIGALNFVTGLADYRRYLWLQPFTFAVRGLHFGRYGLNEADEQRIGPLFLGQPSLLRGYDYNQLVDRCRADMQNNGATGECRLIDQMFGQQLAVANFELRFPLVRALVLGTGFGVPPIEGFLFSDAGVIWGRGTQPVLATGLQQEPGDRGILASAGVGGRVNLFGYAILEAAYVRPFEGGLGWRWHFALQPGF